MPEYSDVKARQARGNTRQAGDEAKLTRIETRQSVSRTGMRRE